jgi:hypothetical protein
MIARHERRLIETHAMLGTVAIITTTMAWAGHRRRGPDFRSRKQGPTKAPLGSKFRLIGLSVQANVFAGSKTSQAPIDNQTELAGNWAGGLDINRDEDFLRAAHEIDRSAGTRGGRLPVTDRLLVLQERPAGEHRRASRTPSVQPHTLLPAAANASRQSRFA